MPAWIVSKEGVYPVPDRFHSLPNHSLFALLFASFVPLAGCMPTAYKITPISADQRLQETTLIDEGGLSPAKIALIDVDGLLLNGHKKTFFGEGEQPVSLFTEKLDKAAKDSRVEAVVLRVNSPGGSVTASDIMYNEILYFKQRTHHCRPVVAVFMDVAASGAYYLSCACDEIVANRTTVTGSIGVIMQMVNFYGSLDKLGIETDAIKSGEMKDAGSPLRRMTPEERELFQKLVNQFYDRFVEVVAKGRPNLDEQKVRAIADGRVYSASEALELGFIDRIGSLRDALQDVKDRLGATHVKVVTYERPSGYKPNIYADAPPGVTQFNMLNVTLPPDLAALEPQFLYLWSPGH